MLVKNFETNLKKSQSQTCIALGMPLPRLCGLQADTPFLEVWVPLLPHMSYRYLCKHISGIVTCTCAAPYANIRAKTSCTSWGGNPCLLHPDLPPDREPAPSGQGKRWDTSTKPGLPVLMSLSTYHKLSSFFLTYFKPYCFPKSLWYHPITP